MESQLLKLITIIYCESFLLLWLHLCDISIPLWDCYAGLAIIKLEVWSVTLVQGACHTVVQSSTCTPVRLLSVAVGEPRPCLMPLTALLSNKCRWPLRLDKFRGTGKEKAVAVLRGSFQSFFVLRHNLNCEHGRKR